MIRIRPARILPLFAALLLAAPALRAQAIGVSAGLALPTGELAENRGVGVRVQGSVYVPRTFVRVDVAGVSFPESSDGNASGAEMAEYRSVSVAANLLPVFRSTETLQVRGLVGLSGHRVSTPGFTNNYGTVPGVQLGGVLERTWGGRTLTAEAGFHSILSDHGLGELKAAAFFPVSMGIRF